MPPEMPDLGSRARLREKIDGPCSRHELRACLRDIARLNRWLFAWRPVLGWLESCALIGWERPVRLLDVGCGYGDGLRRIEKWALARGIAMELTGIDLNPDAVAIAAEATAPSSSVEWVEADVFAYTPPRPVDLVLSSLFTHHLDDRDVVRYVEWMEARAGRGWCINDLFRAPVPYHAFRVFSRITGLHAFVQHDGPVSIARAFVPEEWRRICAAAGLKEQDVTIRGYTPGRLCVTRRKN
jgi:SAM-dependent methyltransferase